MVIYKLGVVDIMAVTTSIFQKHAQEIIVEKLSVSEKAPQTQTNSSANQFQYHTWGLGFVLGLVWVWG